MPNYLFILLFCFVIYSNTLCNASKRPAPLSFVRLNSSAVPVHVCQHDVYSRCRATYDSSYLIQSDSISFGGSRVSESGTFKLGFFVGGGNNIYLGIWYNTNTSTNPEAERIVWVANRDTPISPQQQRYCSLVVAQDGIAKLLCPNNHFLWSSNSQRSYGVTVLQLLDNGNLILTDRSSRKTLWESFQNPTDTILQDQWQYFKTSVNLRSWKSPDDPAQGSYSFQRVNSADYNLSITRSDNPSIPYWTGSLSDLPPILTSFMQEGNANASKMSLRLYLTPNGIIQLLQLDGSGQKSIIRWTAPSDQCDMFEGCGNFGVCDAANGIKCKCLPGFNAPGNDFTGECTRRSSSNTCGGNKDEFLRLPMVNMPPHPVPSRASSDEICKKNCLDTRRCECKAYSYDPDNSNCLIWTQSLTNIQEEFFHPNNATLYVRVSQSDIDYGRGACGICGANVIPYPLSTNSTCGNPNYYNFQCNSSNGQVYFRPTPGGKLYKVSHINETGMKFVVQLPQQGKCDTDTKLLGRSNSSPFSVKNCSAVHLIGRPVVEEVEMSWKPPPPPPCITLSDCDYWPNTTCCEDAKVCKCAKGFHSHLLFLNCTPVNEKGMSSGMKAGIASISGMLLLLGILLFALYLRKRKATQKLGITEIKTDNDIEDIDIPFVDYESILYATDNFSDENKLGVGGFGPVYKGKHANGNTVAIKRLSTASTQGVEEFRNEVIIIAKLQHRNLVRVLGYCAKGNEKILIYEFMPNKSLDAFLFDHNISPQLDWTKRFNIIVGIARGLLYLHQDSRLIIIHRDLKPSNILLDEELNPKISDFGLARIVAGNEMAASTARIIGTHGYMSPEYAMDGYFSIKSDVYSFGILVLETISGKRCTNLLQFENSLISFLGYAWLLWDKGSPMELVDESVESYDTSQLIRCINIGLLCVQEDPSDRPTMSTVVLILSGDNMNLPSPKQPAFVTRRPPSETASSSGKFGISDSNIELTTTIEGR